MKNYFSYFSTKTYVVGTQKNCLNETVLLSTQNTRMGSKVMPLANFYRNFRREDKTHTLYVFSILSPINRCINCTCRHNISREIHFCTNPTQRRLSKMVGRSVENVIKIRADTETCALLSRGSTDIYADICTVYVSNSMSFSTVCRQVRDFSAGIGSVTSAPKYCRSKSASSPKIVIKKYIVKSDARYTSQQIADMVGISKAIAQRFWRNILKMMKESTWWAPHLLNEEQKYTHVRTAHKLFKQFPRHDQ